MGSAVKDYCIQTGFDFSEDHRVCQKTVGNLLWNCYRGCVRKNTNLADSDGIKISKYVCETQISLGILVFDKELKWNQASLSLRTTCILGLLVLAGLADLQAGFSAVKWPKPILDQHKRPAKPAWPGQKTRLVYL